MLADTTWDFGDAILAMLSFFFLVLWIWLLIVVFSDIFRRHDIGGGTKTLWVIFVLVVPVLRRVHLPHQSGSRNGERAQRTQAAAVDQMKQEMSYSVADELEKLDRLHQQGSLSDAEYQTLRAKALA